MISIKNCGGILKHIETASVMPEREIIYCYLPRPRRVIN